MQVSAIVEQGELKHFGDGRGDGGSPRGSEGGSSGRNEIPPRAYITATMVALAGILMFFMAFVSALCGPQGLSQRRLAPSGPSSHLVAEHGDSRGKQLYACAIEEPLQEASRRGFPPLVVGDNDSGAFLAAGQLIAWRQLFLPGFTATNPASSFFYILTAAHGLHLLLGITAMLAVGFRMPRHIPLQTAST